MNLDKNGNEIPATPKADEPHRFGHFRLPEIAERQAMTEQPKPVADCVRMAGTPRWACRWWVRVREAGVTQSDDGSFWQMFELYVPWWAWPLDLAHRAIFRTVEPQSVPAKQS